MPSSVISTTYYDSSTATLRIIYLSGAVYDYLNVPEKVFTAMRKAISKGSFLNKYIKGYYEFKKIN
ncbi:KTSC domain-containing protein [Ferruginibacter albus]|uniref:KTSC domain-containing protein n=1 Tax=Ferruginibacter albus TaxID=2875540 RepID=UPI001CC3F7FE|nr:KTSC domain-containing protein [Ferruginibacter albus]UAY52870.1 KTSC domain-containing protein [Ferruginibacter albus]